jgi:orotidine-5'-phosphate decarboxylase
LTQNPLTPTDRLIVALDVPTVDDARALVTCLGDSVGVFKVGMQLQYAPGGLDFVQELVQAGRAVFLDAKLFDISETIERAVENIAKLGVRFLTIHGNAPTIQAAVRGRGDSALKLLSVTVLTSLDAADLADMGFRDVSVAELVLHRAAQAARSGADGVVASGAEAGQIRASIGSSLSIVTPGIRRASDALGDQKRATTPAQAIAAGATFLVVGRPITKSADPRGEAQRITEEIARVC